MKLNGAEITIRLLERQGIKVIAGIPGGANLPLYNALYESTIRHVLCRHEQGAGFLAHGMARSSGKASVCFATSGPGATNIITAIADAKLDSVPMIIITGQVSSQAIGTDAFQEVDTYGITIPITKHNFLVRTAEELLSVIPEAFTIAQSGRPGPVLIDIPKDVQNQYFEFEAWPEIGKAQNETQVDTTILKEASKMINHAKKPILYIGGGVFQSEAWDNIFEIAHKSQIPVVSTLMGLSCFPSDHPLYLGMLGMHGSSATNHLMEEADLLIALGVRFDDRATGNIRKFCKNAKVLHIDIDHAEINKVRKTELHIVGDLKTVLKELIPHVTEQGRGSWMEEKSRMQKKYPERLPPKSDPWNPVNIIKTIGQSVSEDTVITTDVGQHQMWTAQWYPFKKPRTLLTSGGLGTMGFGLPTAIGAGLEYPDKKVVCVSGDGSILMNIQELVTLSEMDLDVTVVLFNNGHLGLVRQQQEMFYQEHYIASRFEKQVDYVKVAQGFGVRGVRIDPTEDAEKRLNELLKERGPLFIDVPINAKENVLPIVPPGAANYEMIVGDENDG